MKTNDSLDKKSPAELITIIQSLQQENHQLHEKLQLALQARFGAKSEKQVNDRQLNLFDEAHLPEDMNDIETAEEEISVPSHTRRKSGRKPLPDYLPRIERYHDLAEDEKTCACGCALTHIGHECSEQLDFIPATVQVIKHIRLTYACKACEETIKTAPVPKSPIPKSIATPGLLAHVLVSKYADHMPLYRQEGILQRFGIELSRGTLASWVIKTAQLLKPLVTAMTETIINYDVAYADETVLQVLKEPDRTAQQTSYMWLFHGGPPDKHSFVYQYHPSRRQSIPVAFFDGYQGYLHSDAYAGYNALTANASVHSVACWAHVRRKFIEVTKLSKKNGIAHTVVKQIAKLYHIEQQAKQKQLSSEQIKQLRQHKSKPELDKLHAYLNAQLINAAPQSKLASAISYTLTLWQRLNAYLDDGRLEIDNNATERAIKPFVIGRKNWLFANSTEGAKASAIIYSLIQTCQQHKLNLYRYFRYVLEKIPLMTQQDDMCSLLPFNCQDDIA